MNLCEDKNFYFNFLWVCFNCGVCVLLKFRVIKHCARQISKVVLSFLGEKKTFFIFLQEKYLATVLDFTQKNVLSNSDTEWSIAEDPPL